MSHGYELASQKKFARDQVRNVIGLLVFFRHIFLTTMAPKMEIKILCKVIIKMTKKTLIRKFHSGNHSLSTNIDRRDILNIGQLIKRRRMKIVNYLNKGVLWMMNGAIVIERNVVVSQLIYKSLRWKVIR
jgi:hypothetical protein